MGPKNRRPARGKRTMVKKPSPRKMPPAKSPTFSPSGRDSRSSSKGTPMQDPGDKTQYSTPASETPTLQSPRSNERYSLRNITPPSYNLQARARGHSMARTPLRTPAGIMHRTPARNIGRTPVGTPFRTPRLKSLGREPQPDLVKAFKTHKEEAVTWKQHLKRITSKTHKLCYASSMANFKYQNKRLRKKYENHLKRKILDVYPSPLLAVSLSTTSCLTLQPNVVDAVRIEINSLRLGEKDDEDEMVTVYDAWLFRTTESQSQTSKELDWFPVILYNGREAIHYAITDWLQGSFGCYITKFGIRQNDLMWIAGVWSGRSCPLPSHQDSEHLKVDLVYLIQPPYGMDSFPIPNAKGTPKILMGLPLKNIQHVWKNIVDGSSDIMKEEELADYFSTMNTLVEKLTKVPKYLLQLHQLSTPCINLKASGQIRVPCSRSVRILVNHLIDISIQTLNITNRDEISVSENISRANIDAEESTIGATAASTPS